MFFWVVLASLMGIVMFGNLSDKTKDEEFYVEPVYEALSLNLFQYHNAAVYGYEDAIKDGYAKSLNGDANPVAEYFDRHVDGIVPLATVENAQITKGGDDSNVILPYITKYLPIGFKPQNNTRTYLMCVDGSQGQTNGLTCNDPTAVRYVMTFRAIPPRYDGADKMLALRAVAKASVNSRYVGMIEKAEVPLEKTTDTYHQPLGAHYYILASGYSPATAAYLPDYLVCNAPRSNSDSTLVLGDKAKTTRYLVALSLMQGLEHQANIPEGTGIISDCKALEESSGG